MKYLVVICLFIAFSCTNSGTRKAAPEANPAVQENIQTAAVEISIQGMTCTGCEQTIQTGISSINGVKQVKADFKRGKALVEFIPGIADTTQMKEKIIASGYLVANVKSISPDSLRPKL